MNQIEREVARYNAKKDKLTNGFVSRMKRIIAGREQSIQQTNEVMIELNNKRQADQDALRDAEEALRKHA